MIINLSDVKIKGMMIDDILTILNVFFASLGLIRLPIL